MNFALRAIRTGVFYISMYKKKLACNSNSSTPNLKSNDKTRLSHISPNQHSGSGMLPAASFVFACGRLVMVIKYRGSSITRPSSDRANESHDRDADSRGKFRSSRWSHDTG